MKLPAKLKKRAEIGKDYILIDGGSAAFKTSLFDLTGDADTSKVDAVFPKNEGDIEVYHKNIEIKDRLGLSCADKGWLLIDKDFKFIIDDPEIKLTTFKDLYNDIWHTTLILSKNNEIVGIIMGMLYSQDTAEIGKAFDKLNENYSIFKSLTEELDKFLESESVFNIFKEKYPEPFEEDITDKYLDLLIEKVSPAIGKEEQIETYKNKVKITKIVSYPMDTVGYIRIHINGEYYTESVLRGSISLQTRSDSDKDYASMDVFAGFLHNPIGQIRHSWTLNNPLMILNNEDALVKEMIGEMADAMKQSRAADKAYCDYVARTGDLS